MFISKSNVLLSFIEAALIGIYTHRIKMVWKGGFYIKNMFSGFRTMDDLLPRILTEASRAIGVNLGERHISLFEEYYRELIFWNAKINLVSVKSELDIPIKHFIDSLTPLNFVKNKSSSLLDIGTGAGFPGIPLKIAEDRLRVTLLDSSRKKVSFLKNIVRKLQLHHTTVINRRAELLMKDPTYRGIFDVIISRASFKLPQFLTMGEYFISPGGILIAMKGINIDEELEQAEEISTKTGLEYAECHTIELPVTGDRRNIVVYKKARN
ncbi:MAG: 16S rRNA (guanine(527)-N(7))-methyltransferase RsmG [Syntrophales bacterium]|nr:16S rRNA (guanine(527)-N(7))-methyltransferase RsmG [Syntrophales bacterium]